MSNDVKNIISKIVYGIAGLCGTACLGILAWMLLQIIGLEKWRSATEADRWTIQQQSEFADKIDDRLMPLQIDVALIKQMTEQMLESSHSHDPP